MSPSQVKNLLKKKQRKHEFRELRAAERDLGKCGRWSDPALGEQTEHVSLLIIFIMIIFIKIMIIFFMIMISGEQAEHAGVGSLARGRLSRPHRHCQQLARVQRQVKMIGLCKFNLFFFLVFVQVRLNCL